MTETEKEYFQICAWRKLHPLPKSEYGEVHHVFPRSCGGGNWKWNLVRLTPEEHYECHRLLPTIFKELGATVERRKMAFAWCIMHKRNGIAISTKEYGAMRREIALSECGENNPFFGKHHNKETVEHLRTINLGENNPMFGKKLSEDAKKRISEWSSRFHRVSEDGKRRISEAHKGTHHSEETKRKLSLAHMGKRRSEESKRKNSAYSSAARWYHNAERSFFLLPTDTKILELQLLPGRK